MSGLAGFLTAAGQPDVPPEILGGMAAVLPNAECFRSPQVGLAGQLGHNAGGTIHTAAAGTIFNARELAQEFKLSGTASLAELCARGYEAWGMDGLLQRLDGRFVVCVWDDRDRTARLARDPLGQETLFYTERNGRFAFGSRLRCLLHSGLVNGQLDELALWGYLRYRFTPDERTLLAGVRELPPGCCLSWREGTSTLGRYWDPAAAAIQPPASRKQALHQVRERVLDSLNRHVVAGRPAACLVDDSEESAILAALLGRVGPVWTNSVASVDETAALDWIGTGAAWAGDEPLGDPAALTRSLVAQQASGESAPFTAAGAQELFAGRTFFRPRRQPMDRFEADLDSSARVIASLGETITATLKRGRLTLRPGGALDSSHTGRPYALREEFAWALLHPDKRPDFQRFRDYLARIEVRLAADAPATELRRAHYLDVRLWLTESVGSQLRQAPRPLLTPFLDAELAGFLLSWPEEWLANPSSLLREAFPEITPAASRAFESPLTRWLACPLRQLVQETLLGPAMRSLGLFNISLLQSLVEEENITPALAECLWSLLLLGCWHEGVRSETEAANCQLQDAGCCFVPRAEPAPEEPPAVLPRVDIAVPVHEGVALIRDLLRTVEQYTDPAVTPYHLWLIDDASDPNTFERLDKLVRGRPRVTLLRNDTNLGFVGTANRGINTGDAPIVVLLNSDTLVTPGWLERLVRCAVSDDKIALVNPLSNRSDNLSVELPPGLGLETIAARVAESQPTYPDIVTAVGFCLLIKRKYVSWLGGFDPIFGMGYCEESDLHMRFREVGLRAVLADDAYVYHMGNGSFGATWQARYEANRKIFDGRWEDQYWRDLTCSRRRRPVERIQNRLLEKAVSLNDHRELLDVVDGLLGAPRWTPALPVGDYFVSRRQWKQFVNGQARRLERRRTTGDEREVCFPSAPYIRQLPRARGLRITFLLYGLESSGGILSIVQLAREWLLAGHDVQFVTTITDAQNLWPERINLPCQPLIYPSEERLVRDFPPSDIVIPTYWLTAYRWLPRLKERHNFKSVYYVQDYEAWFYPDEHPDRRRVIETFGMTDERVVKSQWLADLLASHGQDCVQIHQGIDLDIFYPRRRRPGKHSRVLACARPHEPRRGFDNLMAVYHRLHHERPELELCLYGCNDADLRHYDLAFPYTNFQRIYDLNRVARIQSDCDILLDPSLYQAFGMPGIEAMACGTATVLPNIGGIHEYAVDEVNTLLVTPANERAAVAAILRLVDDSELRQQLVQRAFEQPSKFCHRHEARVHLELYERLLNNDRRTLSASA